MLSSAPFVSRFSQLGAIATEKLSPVTRARQGVNRQTDTQTDRRQAITGRQYVTLMAGYYNENFHVDMPQTFHTTDRRIALTRPLIYAELDYCNSLGTTFDVTSPVRRPYNCIMDYIYCNRSSTLLTVTAVFCAGKYFKSIRQMKARCMFVVQNVWNSVASLRWVSPGTIGLTDDGVTLFFL